MTGCDASEVGANYTKLRDFLKRRDFKKADLETASKILWIAKRKQEGWLREEDIKNLPSKDLHTINQLWIVASKEKFGFSVQKQIWVNLGGKPIQNEINTWWRFLDNSGNNFRQDDINIFWRFLEEVEWIENEFIFDQRAVKGHLPTGVYVKLSHDLEINQKWKEAIGKTKFISKFVEMGKTKFISIFVSIFVDEFKKDFKRFIDMLIVWGTIFVIIVGFIGELEWWIYLMLWPVMSVLFSLSYALEKTETPSVDLDSADSKWIEHREMRRPQEGKGGQEFYLVFLSRKEL